MAVTLDGTTGVSGPVGLSNGSTSSPTLRGLDTNTGVYFPDANQLAIVIDGSVRALFSTTSEITGSLRNSTSAFLSTDSGAVHVGAATAPDAYSSKMQVTNTSGSTNGNQSALILSQGGSAENGGQLKLINSYPGVSTPNKHIRINNSGQLEIINSAYNGTILNLTDAGGLTVGSRGISKASMPAGSVLQVVTARTGSYFSSSSTSWTDITGLSATITPTSSTSKIFIMLSLGRATTAQYNLDHSCAIRILGNGSDALNINGDANGSRPRIAMNVNGLAFNADHSPGGFGVSALESPGTTSAVTYKAQVLCQSASYPFILNGTPNNSDTGNIYHARGASSITLWEIAA